MTTFTGGCQARLSSSKSRKKGKQIWETAESLGIIERKNFELIPNICDSFLGE